MPSVGFLPAFRENGPALMNFSQIEQWAQFHSAGLPRDFARGVLTAFEQSLSLQGPIPRVTEGLVTILWIWLNPAPVGMDETSEARENCGIRIHKYIYMIVYIYIYIYLSI